MSWRTEKEGVSPEGRSSGRVGDRTRPSSVGRVSLVRMAGSVYALANKSFEMCSSKMILDDLRLSWLKPVQAWLRWELAMAPVVARGLVC